ncbi:MAG: hypothetical protein QF890_07805 [Myxococcota bacterium]|jgi:hypothetical protein|nr:hypothetical protein [Deltaproteobacteria bacterium]MCP4240968.1 hypothetical protein [bacterium]MDP6074973.1 hypothetical protein [Myxococcota bacterium]MDP6243949.1 hypothetical protein [Myxococcota bacterium]MDP7076268.1 hypothetical protein [Myxococcota bacterium]
MPVREAHAAALAASLLILGLPACVLPVRTAPGVAGRVVDRASGAPVSNAIVVVRFDGRYGDQFPDREHIGHAETRTAADGSFDFERYSSAGLSVWPLFRTEVRIVSVFSPGHRCPDPLHVTGLSEVEVTLDTARNSEDQRDSCPTVASRRGETDQYRAAWRALHPSPETTAWSNGREPLERALAARNALGFGANCAGPVTDLALAPDGAHVAYVSDAGGHPQTHLAALEPTGPASAQAVASVEHVPPRRLVWTGPGELALWLPVSPSDSHLPSSILARGRAEVIWTNRNSLPAAPDRGIGPPAPPGLEARPLDPEDLSDESDTRRLGRSFGLERTLDIATGLPHDRLLVRRPDGFGYAIPLPGEACGGARFGRPQARIGAEGRFGFDLRFVQGGCHAVAIDLETGAWSLVDRAQGETRCRARRTLPPLQLTAALRGWTRELHDAMRASGVDPRSSYALRIGEHGATRVIGRSFKGATLTVDAPRFPVATPLQRIDITNVSPVGGGDGRPVTAPPAMEPL